MEVMRQPSGQRLQIGARDHLLVIGEHLGNSMLTDMCSARGWLRPQTATDPRRDVLLISLNGNCPNAG